MAEVVKLLRQLLHEFGTLVDLLREIRDELRRARQERESTCRLGVERGQAHTPGERGRCTHCGDKCAVASGECCG